MKKCNNELPDERLLEDANNFGHEKKPSGVARSMDVSDPSNIRENVTAFELNQTSPHF